MAGLNPQGPSEVNMGVGSVLRQFVAAKDAVNRSQASIAPLSLTEPPYSMSTEDETLIKSAMNDLDTALDAIDMTWISRLIGIY